MYEHSPEMYVASVAFYSLLGVSPTETGDVMGKFRVVTFYSLLGVSYLLNIVILDANNMLKALSTPFWEFLTVTVAPVYADIPLFLLPFGSFL